MFMLLGSSRAASIGRKLWRRARTTGHRLLGRGAAKPYGRERKVDDAVTFTLNSVKMYRGFLPTQTRDLSGKMVAEIGPGQDLGVPLVLAGFGCQAVVVDQYLAEWEPTYHPAFYSELLDRARTTYPEGQFDTLAEVVRNKRHRAKGLHIHAVGLEGTDKIASESIDVTISNAVFEHLADPGKAVAQLSRITKRGGCGFHQVDFRDHRDFSRPLEFLTIADHEFESLIATNAGTSGNRVRWSEYQSLFVANGFRSEFKPQYSAEEEYFADVQPRMTRRYRSMPPADVAVLSGRFFLSK